VAGRTAILLYDIGGREVAKVVDAKWPAGERDIVRQMADLTPGVYFLRAKGPDGMKRVLKVLCVR
jgi:hypothetical protein